MNWPTTRLKNVAQVRISNVDKKSAPGEPEVRLCNYVDVYKNDAITPGMELMRATASREQVQSFRVQAGDTLLTKDSETVDDIAVPAYVRDAAPDMLCGYHLAMVRPASDVYPRYLYWSLVASAFRQQMTAAATGITRFGLRRDSIGSGAVHLPLLDEQRRIADFLDAETGRVGKLRAMTHRQIGLASERLREFIRTVTTSDTHDLGIPTGIPWMPSIPSTWTLVKLSYAFRAGSGTTPSSANAEYFGGPYPWVNSGDLADGVVHGTTRSVTAAALHDYPALKLFPAGTLVVAMYGAGATKGRVGILDLQACVNQACCALASGGGVSAEFASYWFRAHRDGIVSLAIGAGQPNLSLELICGLKIPAPRLQIQDEIVRTAKGEELGTRRKIAALEKRALLLEERRQALITAAVTGQFDVTTAGRAAEWLATGR